jgi:hypothetical protein
MRSNSFKERPVGFKRHFPETVTGNFDKLSQAKRAAFACSHLGPKAFMQSPQGCSKASKSQDQEVTPPA